MGGPTSSYATAGITLRDIILMVSNYYKITIPIFKAIKFPDNGTCEMNERAGLGYNMHI